MSSRPRSWPVFRELPDALYRTIVREAGTRSFARGEAVFHRGAHATELHLIEKGHFAVEYTGTEGNSVVVAILGPGETFGEVALVEEDATRSASVISLEAGRTAVIDRAWFARLREKDPSVDRLVIAVLTAQVRRLTERAFEAARVSPRQRVRRRLAALAQTYGGGDGRAIPITTDVLADLAGTSRARVSEVIQEEKAAGTIAARRGRITVLSIARLEARAKPEA